MAENTEEDKDKQTPPAAAEQKPAEKPPEDDVDALDKPEADGVVDATKKPDGTLIEGHAPKPPSPLKRFLQKVNIYLLGFILILVVVGGMTAMSMVKSQKAPVVATFGSQELNDDALKKLASSDVNVGSAAQTLTVQGNTVLAGQVLVRSDLSAAGNVQVGGTLQAPSLTISGKTNLADTQINTLQVASNTTIQGATTVKDLNVGGAASFGGPVNAGQITVTKLIMSGNASLQVPNHIAFTGPSPGRSVNPSVLGGSGTASINGSDTTGTVNINIGGSPTAGCFVNITFSQAFTSTPHVLLTPVGSAAGLIQYYITRTNSGFSICTNNPAPANQSFAFDYFVTAN